MQSDRDVSQDEPDLTVSGDADTAAEPGTTKSGAFSRRAFIGGSTAAVAIGSAALADNELDITQHDGDVVVSFGRRKWLIRKAFFEPAGLVGMSLRFDDNGAADKKITLSGAYFPGTDLLADFTASFHKDVDWAITVEFKNANGGQQRFALSEWMAALDPGTSALYSGAIIRRKRIHLPRIGSSDHDGPGIQLPTNSSIAMRPAPVGGLAAELKAAPGAMLTFDVSASASGFLPSSRVIPGSTPPSVLGRPVDRTGQERGFVTAFAGATVAIEPGGDPIPALWCSKVILGTQAQPLPPTTIALGSIQNELRAYADFQHCDIKIVAFSDNDHPRAIVTVTSPNAALSIVGATAASAGLHLQFEQKSAGEPVTVRFEVRKLADGIRFSGVVARHPFALETRYWTAIVAGLPGSPKDLTFGRTRLPPIQLSVNLCSLHIPVDDAIANVNFSSGQWPLTIGGPPPAALRAGTDHLLWIGHDDSVAEAGLEQTRMRVNRTTDLFDMSFGFRHHALTASRAGTQIRMRRVAIGAGLPAPETPGYFPRVIFYFPPQHLFEEVVQDYPKNQRDQRMGMEDMDIARTRIADPSRLVFEDRCETEMEGRRQPLTVDYLTQWVNMATVVSPRAFRSNAGLADQLSIADITPTMLRSDVKRRFYDFHNAPTDDETAIEAVFRLQFSPDETARWLLPPRGRANPKLGEMWSLRLDNSRATAVRALWARTTDFVSRQDTNLSVGFGDSSEPLPFFGSLNDNDRVQIAALSSYAGMAALRRVIETEGKLLGDDPNGMVLLPQECFAYLDERLVHGLPQEGIVVAKPFDKFDLKLSRSGTLNALWKGEPPAGYAAKTAPDPFFRPAFSIERYAHRIQDGRDAYVEVVYKGFLLPFGHRAALLKLTQREIHRTHGVEECPTAYLVERMFIVCTRPLKKFAAYNQPFASKDFPVKTAELLTTKSPEINFPDGFPADFNGCPDYKFVPEVTKLATKDPVPPVWPPDDTAAMNPRPDPTAVKYPVRMFWPELHLKPSPGQPMEVMFDVKLDDEKTPVRCPMLFVDNAAAHEADFMQCVADYYNTRIGDTIYLRAAAHGGVARRYAPEQTAGECTHQTFNWQMGVRGLVSQSLKTEQATDDVPAYHYDMDALMEGADQPPFYPFVDQATVSVQSINRLIGKPNQQIDIRYSGHYTLHGFDPARNPSRIYAEVIRPNLHLDPSADSQSVGGVATGGALIKALSHKGPVGGRDVAIVKDKTAQSVPHATAAVPYASALSGRFDPIEYFAGALNDAKLLGIISLKDILRAVAFAAAPKLVEKAQYQVDAASEKVRDLTWDALKAVAKSGGPVRHEIDRLAAIAPQIAPYYPALANSITVLSATLEGIEKQNSRPSPELDEIYGHAATVIGAVKDVIAQLRDIASDPIPANIRGAIDDLKELWKEIQTLATLAKPQDLLNEILNSMVLNFCDALFESGAFEHVFGPLNHGGPAIDLFAVDGTRTTTGVTRFPYPAPIKTTDLSDPAVRKRFIAALQSSVADALPHLNEAMYAETLGKPIAAAIDAVNQLRGAYLDDPNTFKTALAWSRRLLVDRILDALRFDQASGLIAETTEVAWRLVGIIEDIVLAMNTVDQIEKQIKDGVTAAKAEIRTQLDGLNARAQSDLLTALDDKKKFDDKAAAALVANDTDGYYNAIASAEECAARATALCAVSYALTSTANDPVNTIAAVLQEAASEIIKTAIADAKKAVIDYGKAQERRLIDRLARLVQPLLDQALATCNAAAAAAITRAVAACDAVNGKAVPAFKAVAAEIVYGLNPDGWQKTITDLLVKFDRNLNTTRKEIINLHVDPSLEVFETARAQLLAGIAAVAAADERMIAIIDDYSRLLLQFKNGWNIDLCSVTTAEKLRDILDPLGRALDLRRRAVHAVVDLLTELNSLYATSQSLLKAAATRDVENLVNLVLAWIEDAAICARDLLIEVAAARAYKLATDILARIDALITDTAAALPHLKDLWAETRQAAAKVYDALLLAQHVLDILKEARELLEFTVTKDRKLAGEILQLALGRAPGLDLVPPALNPLETIVEALTEVDCVVGGLIGKLADTVNSSDVVRSVLSRNVLENLTQQQAALDGEGTILQGLLGDIVAIQAATDDASRATLLLVLVKDITDLKTRWQKQPPAALGAVTFIEGIVSAVMAGHVRSLFADPEQIKQILEDAIADLLPVQIDLTYDFDAALPDFPSSSPIFMIDRSAQSTIPNDLFIHSEVKVNLLTGARSVNAQGQIRPFKVHLLGSSLDLVTLKFNGAHFSMAPGAGASFDCKVSGIEIGSALAFISAFAGLGSGGGGNKDNGFFYHYSMVPPEIEVGYGFNKPYIELGALAIQNLGFRVSAFLPFDNRQAEFRFSFASREKPFLVSAKPPTPYGGGGFVGFRANARGIIALEVSFEFGAILALEAGPLSASGRLTAGIYMLSYSGGARRLEGFVHFEGEAHIACFGINAVIDIRTIHTPEGSMEGSATYSYSFHVGFAEIGYTVTTGHKTQGGGGGGGGDSGGGSGSQQLRANNIVAGRAVPGIVHSAPARPYTIGNNTPPKANRWNEYVRHYVI